MKKILLAVVPILVIIAVSCIYFMPALSGEAVNQHDVVQYEGASKEVKDFRKEHNEEPLWTNSLFSGMPTYGITIVYKNVYIKKISNWFRMGLPKPISFLFINILGFYLLMLSLGCNKWVSLIGSLAFAFSSYFFIIINVGHNTKALAIAQMAPVVMGVLLTYRGKYLWGGIITAFAVGLELVQNHPQITYYLAFIVFFYAIFQFVEDYNKKALKHFFTSSIILVIAAALGLGMNISNYLVLLEYKTESTRGHSELADATVASKTKDAASTKNYDLDYITAWSYGIPETLTLLIPDIMGGANQRSPGLDSHVYNTAISKGVPKGQAKQIATSLPMYWGDQPFTSGPVYFGAFVCFLFVFGLFVIKGKIKWWIVSITIFSLMLSWGHNMMWLSKLLIYYFPGYDAFRAPSMALVIAQFTMPLLATLALMSFIKSDDKKSLLKPLKLSLYITGGICLFVALLGGTFFDFVGGSDARMVQGGYPQWLIDALRVDRETMMQTEAYRSLAFIVVGFVSLYMLAINKLRKEYVLLIVGLVIVVDLWVVDKRYMNDDHFVAKKKMEQPFTPTNADLQILKDTDLHYRVFNTTVNSFNDNSTSYFHKSVGGYSAVKLQRYQDIIEKQLSTGNMEVFNMLNTKYFIKKGQDGSIQPQLNGNALGNAWFVSKLSVVDNANAEMNALRSFNPSSEVIVDKRFDDQLTGFSFNHDAKASITLTSYKPNELIYSYSSASPQLTVFSEVFYDKGWKLYVDDEEIPYFRANYILRSAILEAGEHEVKWVFKPNSYVLGGKIALVSFAIALLLLLYALYRDKKKVAGIISELK